MMDNRMKHAFPLAAACAFAVAACADTADESGALFGGPGSRSGPGDAIPADPTHSFEFGDSSLRYQGDVGMQVWAWREGADTNYQLVLSLSYTIPYGLVVGNDALTYGGLQCLLNPEQAESLFGGGSTDACGGGSLLEYFVDERAAAEGVHAQRPVRRLQSMTRAGTNTVLSFELDAPWQREDGAPTSLSALGPLRIGCSVSGAPISDGPIADLVDDSGWNTEECRAVAAALQIEELLPQ